MNEQRALGVLATGHALPTTVIDSEQLDLQLGYAPGRIAKLSGVRSRYRAAPGETAAQLAAQAVRKALAGTELKLSDIDLLVACSATMDQGMPSNAALIHAELGLQAVPAFDINASCLGFLTALDQLSWPIAAGRYRRVVIVAADIASCGLDWQQLEASAIFGDGAAAAVVGPSANNGGSMILASEFMTHSQGVHWCEIPAGGSRHHPSRQTGDFLALSRFHMQGKKVFRWAKTQMPSFVDRLLSRANLTRADIDWLVPHQASHLALDYLEHGLGFARERVINIYPDHGNQVAASLPTALDIAINDGRIQRGQRLLLLGTGAGLSAGGLIMEY